MASHAPTTLPCAWVGQGDLLPLPSINTGGEPENGGTKEKKGIGF